MVSSKKIAILEHIVGTRRAFLAYDRFVYLEASWFNQFEALATRSQSWEHRYWVLMNNNPNPHFTSSGPPPKASSFSLAQSKAASKAMVTSNAKISATSFFFGLSTIPEIWH